MRSNLLEYDTVNIKFPSSILKEKLHSHTREPSCSLRGVYRSWQRLTSLQKRLFFLLFTLLCLFCLISFRMFYDHASFISTHNKINFDYLPERDVRNANEESSNLNTGKLVRNGTFRKNNFSSLSSSAVLSDATRRASVISSMRFAWNAYKRDAWGKDTLKPISHSYEEWFHVGLTIVDSLDTLYLMGLNEDFAEAKNWVATELSFEQDVYVNLFEITIRSLGGLLSAFHLSGDEVFREKARDLGDRLMPCFNKESAVPFSDVNLKTGHARDPLWGSDSTTSEITTIQLEFTDLSNITQDPKYKNVVKEVSDHMHSLRKNNGLVPIFINVHSGNFRSSATISLGARGDSYYEYLLKQWVQDRSKVHLKDDYLEAMQGVKEKLWRLSEPNKLAYVGELINEISFSSKMDHLVCFLPGTLSLGYSLGLSDEHLVMAKALLRTCIAMYTSMPTGLSPEIAYFNTDKRSPQDIIVKPQDAHNLLRPETVESLFYLHTFTGDKEYSDVAWDIFLALEKYAKVPTGGYSSLSNVKNPENPGFRDKMESFFLSETLKYLYLTFANSTLDLQKWVFNSEGHPLPIHIPPSNA